MKTQELRKLIREEVKKALSENTQLMSDPTVKSKVEMVIKTLKSIDIDGETMQYILEQIGMDEQMLHQLTPGGIRENTKINLKKNGIYILDGGLNNNDEWDEKSLKKAQVLYYTTDFRDPKLEKYKKDGIVKVEITDDGDIDVVQY